MNRQITQCGVIGNPIKHSLSPEIHRQFSESINMSIDYQKYLVEPAQLNHFVVDFFAKGGRGLNVTLPFKQQVIESVETLSEAARICQSVNTLSQDLSGKICGDTTDGDGLILDLARHDFSVTGKNILVIGAGGASVSVIYALLKKRANVRLLNRTESKVQAVVEQFSMVGQIEAFNPQSEIKFDGVICSVSEFNKKLFDQMINSLNDNAFVYDLNYSERAKSALDYFSKNGFKRSADGYGMLIGQAAKSFEIWHGVLPSY